MDMSPFVVPKSDQINADDLIGGPRTILITRVSGTNNADQPVAVHFEGDNGKPFKPCKSMRRVMIAAWGMDASKYVGRSMTIYRDPKVVFGGMEVGGIRISAMSHIDKPLSMALTVTKARRAPYKVAVLDAAPAVPKSPEPAPHSTWESATLTRSETNQFPVSHAGETRYAASLGDWCATLIELSNTADPTNVLQANIRTYDWACANRTTDDDVAHLDALRAHFSGKGVAGL